MKRLLIVLSCAAAALFLSAPSFAQSAHVHGGKARLQVSAPLQVGQVMVPPAEYKFECREIDGKDYLVLSRSDGKEVARVPCRPEVLQKKVTDSSFLVVATADGSRKLVEVRIKGETVAHTVAE
jgi:hypothetical protein